MVLKLNRLIVAAIAFTTIAACTQTETVAGSLKKIQNTLSENNSVNAIQYQLGYNEDFPCQVSIKEHSENANSRWLKRYQFDLTDIAKNSFIQSKPGRRAIIYTSAKQTSDINKKAFKPVKINNFSLQTNVSENDQRLIISEINKAIALCEEEYSFEKSVAEE